jgi:hypothetical protein
MPSLLIWVCQKFSPSLSFKFILSSFVIIFFTDQICLLGWFGFSYSILYYHSSYLFYKSNWLANSPQNNKCPSCVGDVSKLPQWIMWRNAVSFFNGCFRKALQWIPGYNWFYWPLC